MLRDAKVWIYRILSMNKQKQLIIEGTVSEMTNGDAFKIEVPLAAGVDIAKLTLNDPDPMFVVIEAINEGQSKNGRFYNLETIQEIAKQINDMKPDAYEGHLKDEERAYKTPQSKTIWIGATVVKMGGKNRLFVKGYVLPYAVELKQYLSAAKATSKKVAVSIYGKAREVLENGLRRVSEFVLESIDWARSGSEGVPTLGYMAITREMEEGGVMDRKVVLEMIESLRGEIEEKVRGELEAQAPVSVISEMQGKIDGLEHELTDIFIEKELTSRVGNVGARKLVKSIVLAEMKAVAYNRDNANRLIDTTLASDDGKSIIQEMSKEITVNPLTVENEPSRKYTSIK